MQDRRRNLLVLLLVAGLLAASAAVIALKPTMLGLDLKGGIALVYKAQPTPEAKVTPESINQAIEIMRKRVDGLGVSQPEILRTGKEEIAVNLPNASNAKRAQEQVGKPAQMHFYDWETNVIGPNGKVAGPGEPSVTGGQAPGTTATGLSKYEAVRRAAKRPAYLRKKDTTWETGCTLQRNEASGPNGGCVFGQWYLLDTTAKKVIGSPETTKADLSGEGHKVPQGHKTEAVHVNPGTIVVRALPVETTQGKVTQQEPESFYVLNDEPVLSGSDIKNPREQSESGSGQPAVTFEFTGSGGKVFERVTREIAERGRNAQLPGVTKAQALQHFAIVLDEQLITVPSIDYTAYPEGIDATNGSQISGGFTITTAQNLADELRSGALPIKLELISNSQISATLGKEALSEGLKAGLIGFAVVCLFLLLFYRVLGLIAVGGLVIYSVYFFALIKLIPITMTLPGIAGLILTIGVAADANIVIFERVKEEIRSGRSVVAGIATGYKKGFAAIVDANVVTFMTAFILFALATAEVQGFAFTLGIGTLASLFTAVLATQAALGTMSRTGAVSHPAMLGAGRAGRKWKFDFMGASKWFFSLSGVILLIGALAIGGKGINFGFDFTGGTQIETQFVKPTTTAKVSQAMSQAGFPNAVVQRYEVKKGGAAGYDIKIKQLGPNRLQQLKAELDTKFGEGTTPGTKNFSDKSIGPTFGEEIAKSAVIAIIASLLVISAYIALRFEWKYAVPVLIALAHDLLITSGIYALTGREVTSATVAALLTILGYSMYDTIIVFDRIRENVPRMPRAAFSQIVNRSMSEVLTRSLATSFCTLLPVLALLIFGGATLQDFAFALLVGIASGAYSSIFIASPVLTHWKEREPVYRNRRLRLESEFGAVPAYATSGGGQPVDVEPNQARKRRRGIMTAEEPGEQLSKEEFDELVRDLDIEQEPTGGGSGRRGRRGGSAVAQRSAASREGNGSAGAVGGGQENGTAKAPEPAEDATPEDLVMKREKRREKPKRPRNRRHGRH